MGENDMTEREKMPAGELYDCGDPELLERWHLAKDLIKQYNGLSSADLKASVDHGSFFLRLRGKYFSRKSLRNQHELRFS